MKARPIEKRQNKVKVFSAADNQCIWMKAGVINFKLCDNAYDCLSCPFDKAMSRSLKQKKGEVVSWRQVQRKKAYDGKECRHMLTGRVRYHFCSNSYRCNTCEFDQTLDEADFSAAQPAIRTRKVAGFSFADDYYYHKGHAWARVEYGGFVRLGIDDFASRLLGTPGELQVPRLGSHVEQTKVGWTLIRKGKPASVLAPMTGVVVATNQKVLHDPHAIGSDPFGDGWLLVIQPVDMKKEVKNLLFRADSEAWLESEAGRLNELVMNTYGRPLAATGGEVVDDIYGNISHLISWEDLVHEFLLT